LIGSIHPSFFFNELSTTLLLCGTCRERERERERERDGERERACARVRERDGAAVGLKRGAELAS